VVVGVVAASEVTSAVVSSFFLVIPYSTAKSESQTLRAAAFGSPELASSSE